MKKILYGGYYNQSKNIQFILLLTNDYKEDVVVQGHFYYADSSGKWQWYSAETIVNGTYTIYCLATMLILSCPFPFMILVLVKSTGSIHNSIVYFVYEYWRI